MNMGGSWHNSQYWDIPGKVSFIPAYSQDTIDAFFSKIDVLLFPTQWKESFGLTVREALVRDVWVIATDAGGVSEDLVDGVNSTVIPFDSDHLVLKDAIEACIERNDWHSYKNPHREKVRGYEEQAVELHGYFESLLENSEG
jgi:glycosyltransferase involved in cell wall biosynthesis